MAAQLLITFLGDDPLGPLVLARQVDAERVVCVGRPDVEWRVPALLEILRREGRRGDWLPIDDADVPAALAELQAKLSDGAREQGDGEVVFDLTNARGVVGLALYELARRRERAQPGRCRLVRVDWSDRLVRAISPDRADAERLGVRVELGEFLELHGKRLLGVERARGSAGHFGRAAYRIAGAVAAAQPLLEAVHHGAWDRPLRVRAGQGADRQATDRLIADLAEDGVLEQRDAVYLASQGAFQFLHGRWLEEYLFEVADASGRFNDCASGVRFKWAEEGDLVNEIDFAGTAGGRATVASCKTGFGEAAAPLYELLTLAERAAGRSVVPVFATSQTFDRSARHRAAALGIRVLDAERLADPSRVLAALLGDRAARR